MSEEKKENKVTTEQSADDIQQDMPVKTKATDPEKNTAAESDGLNQEKLNQKGEFPSDGGGYSNS